MGLIPILTPLKSLLGIFNKGGAPYFWGNWGITGTKMGRNPLGRPDSLFGEFSRRPKTPRVWGPPNFPGG